MANVSSILRIRTKAGISKQPDGLGKPSQSESIGLAPMSYVTRRTNPRLIYFPWHPNPKPLRKLHSFCCVRQKGALESWRPGACCALRQRTEFPEAASVYKYQPPPFFLTLTLLPQAWAQFLRNKGNMGPGVPGPPAPVAFPGGALTTSLLRWPAAGRVEAHSPSL